MFGYIRKSLAAKRLRKQIDEEELKILGMLLDLCKPSKEVSHPRSDSGCFDKLVSITRMYEDGKQR